MQDHFQKQIQYLVPGAENKRFLIAASGGLDSTVLIHLCNVLGMKFGICHVNFKLRGQDSDEDQRFLEDLAHRLNCPVFVLEKNAKVYANKHQLSTQEAARQIRYQWFKDCLDKENYDAVMTAHHADDDLETYLVNSFRGTGIRGLTGISQKRDSIIRPLLKFTRDEILTYANQLSIQWREDQSNASDHYLRNVIRHHLIPFFDKRQDDLHARFKTTQNNINRQKDLLDDYINMVFKQMVKATEETYRFDIKTLKTFPHPKNILIELLKDFGFTDWDSVYGLVTAQVGKYVTSSTHKLVKERGFLELFVLKNDEKKPITINLDKLPKTVSFAEGKLSFETVKNFDKATPNIAFISKDLLKSSLLLRPYERGDYFCPLGMQGRRKLSDFLKDEKLSTKDKSKIWVLCHNHNIIWVVNQRIDNRYKTTDNTTTCLKITYFK
ncbi:tRNA lysidine(34) synthetase TilS [Mesohalobacter halotolerans]|uniref:tRNA(Ile)-lysidine synthase n=1 Tax=Mesohalobacter halotolerans TaxID=1883405 RepID=A0A4U5TTU5_9FLAO|nr:tRNA lysidine(34) synthetase TilS [Mesohalobacter halotolerans]MBS3738006.1 tRNA lysidine(34) synthetase TilS [Psychroflexus sp.]TKS56708.1 tRNA lysidine(34) synthetase TilS [Mesohalobacter halotolerans]